MIHRIVQGKGVARLEFFVRRVLPRFDGGTVVAVHGASLTIAGEDGERVLLASPGTRLETSEGPIGLDSLAAGLRVAVAFDDSPTGSALPVLAWLLVTEGQ